MRMRSPASLTMPLLVVAMFALLALLPDDCLGLPWPAPRPLIADVEPQHQALLLGRAESCKSVSIPAKTACAPGLVCSPKSGTCVPAGNHLKSHHYSFNKIPTIPSLIQ